MYMLLCLGGRNVHVAVPGRKECTRYCVWKEGIYMLLCLGGRKEHLGGRNLLVKIFALLGCYEAWIVVSYQLFGPTYRYHF